VIDADRHRLLGKYRTPRYRIGQKVRCQVRGKVVIVGLSDAPIPWPLCKRRKWLVPVVYQGLARALRLESAQAIVHHWGVGQVSVSRWRKALGVGHRDLVRQRRVERLARRAVQLRPLALVDLDREVVALFPHSLFFPKKVLGRLEFVG
jgi:hypothetical protein